MRGAYRVARTPAWAVATLAVAIVACGGPGEGRSARVALAETTPDFALPDLDGKLVRLSDSAGKVRLVDFWATWCAPCREEIPTFKHLHATYGGRGFALIAISLDEEPEKVVPPFVEPYEIPYTNLIGNEEVGDAFGGIPGLPTAFLLDREGRIVERFVGAVPKSVLEGRIKTMLEVGAAS